MNRRMLLRIAASGAAAEFVTKRELEAQSRAVSEDHGCPRNSDGGLCRFAC